MQSIKNSSITVPNLCSHLKSFKKIHGLNGYRAIEAMLVSSGDGKVKLCPTSYRCCPCSLHYGRRYLCLVCDFVACPFDAVGHSKSEKGHVISVDLDRAELFCCECNDQVYDPDFDSMVVDKVFGSSCSMVEDSKLKSVTRKKCYGTRSRDRVFNRDTSLKSSSCYPLGLRGLNNLGNTCYMNSVLQALLHTVPLKNYFLNDQHNREDCQKKRKRKKRGTAELGETLCLVCDVDKVYMDVFSDESTPYSPTHFLYSWWRHSSDIASYEQHDAHEFFISMLDKIHEIEQAGRGEKARIEDCHCIAHQVFSGTLRSDVTCTVCGSMSTTYDPFVDISLDIERCNATTEASGKSIETVNNPKESTLMGSLNLFTRPESLSFDEKLYCGHCQSKQDSVKQMSIQKLPPVLCLHVKRFEHSTTHGIARKLDQYVQFPFALDMKPYLSSSIIRKRFSNRIFTVHGVSLDEISSDFEVFAVVTHSGMLNAGHYVTYLRLEDQWYECNDPWISQVSEWSVRACQAYLLYYVEKSMYRPASKYDNVSALPRNPIQGWTDEDILALPPIPKDWMDDALGLPPVPLQAVKDGDTLDLLQIPPQDWKDDYTLPHPTIHLQDLKGDTALNRRPVSPNLLQPAVPLSLRWQIYYSKEWKKFIKKLDL